MTVIFMFTFLKITHYIVNMRPFVSRRKRIKQIQCQIASTSLFYYNGWRMCNSSRVLVSQQKIWTIDHICYQFGI